MSREGALMVMMGVALVLIGLMGYGWWRRRRRDSRLTAPGAEAPTDARVLARFGGLYVATTAHGDPLERLAVRGLGFRSRAELTVTDAGVVLALTGQETLFLSRDRLIDASQATVAIDRVVERDGLARLRWRLDDGTVVDSYFRPQEASARAVAGAMIPLLPESTATGTDA